MIERIVLFGATGDLAARLLLPSLAVLMEDGEVSPDLEILGLGRKGYDTDSFREKIAAALEEHAPGVKPQVREDLVRAIRYRRTDVSAADQVGAALQGIDQPALVYLALAPNLFEPALLAIAQAGLPAESVIAIEKPFGDSLQSAIRLNTLLRQNFPATTIFRVDHFLSDALVQQVVALRFANRFFEPLWSNEHIERVDIVWDETLTLEGRASYYDTAGALKDMIQNHLLEVLAVVTMDQPSRLDEPSYRDARVAVLRAIPTMTPEQATRRSVRGRYVAGELGGRSVPAYVDEPGIDPERDTETYAQVTLEIANWRWAGVPFTLRSGKALREDRGEVIVTFRKVPDAAYRSRAQEANVLRLGLMSPSVRLSVSLLSPDLTLRQHEMELFSFAEGRPAYANLLLSMLRGNAMLTIRSDEAEESWRIVEPVVQAWAEGMVPLMEYPAGSEGPSGQRGL
jgi:glucose-6-phosphate 1-dehydrogenase